MRSRTEVAIASATILLLALAGLAISHRKASPPAYALEVTLIGHQYWWEIRYPQLGIVTANELHIPVDAPDHPEATRLTITSADIEHSFTVPALDLTAYADANAVSTVWVRPKTKGVYVGGCPKDCSMPNAQMRLSVHVDSPADFRAWAVGQKDTAVSDPDMAQGRAIFEHTACMSCHTVAGTAASGRFGPDLTHVASRDTIAAGLLSNTKDNLSAFIDHPTQIKPGCLMPAMHLSPHDLDLVTNYLASLK